MLHVFQYQYQLLLLRLKEMYLNFFASLPIYVQPATGVSQILRALEKCGGQATITKLNWAYHSLFGKQLDAAEMTRHFGTNNMRKIHSSYLLDKVSTSLILLVSGG